MASEETKGAGTIWQSTVINVSNQIRNKLFLLLLLVGIDCRSFLTRSVSSSSENILRRDGTIQFQQGLFSV